MIKSALQSSLTNDVKYRSMSVGNVPSSEFLIQTALVTDPVSTIEFSNLAQHAGVYRHLQLVIVARGGRALGNEPIYLQFNGSGGTAYSTQGMAGTTSNQFFIEGSSSLSSIERAGNIAGASAASGAFGGNIVDILDPFNSSKNTTIRTIGGGEYGSGPVVGLFAGLWNNTSSLTSIRVTNFSGTNFAQFSRFSLYGVTA